MDKRGLGSISRATTMIVAVLAVGVFVAGHAQATMLFAWSDASMGLCSLDTGPPPTAALIGGGNPGIISEIEYGGGTIYGADTDDNTLLRLIDPSTGMYTSTTTLTFPAQGNVLTSLEFVGDTLYAGLTTEGGGPTYFSTVNLGSGVVSVIGATGVSSPLGGLAYDATGATMYAISAGGSAAELFTIDMGSGAATSVGLVTIGGVSFGATALEFGDDGVLYSLANQQSTTLRGNLLSIDPATGDATNLGFTGVNWLLALTSPGAQEPNIPEPATLGLLALGGLGLLRKRRRVTRDA